MKKQILFSIILFILIVSCDNKKQILYINELNLDNIDIQENKIKIDSTIHGKPIVINGVEFNNGIGLSAHSAVYVHLFKNASSFSGFFGYDQNQFYHDAACEVILTIIGDDKILFQSEELGFWSEGIEFNIDLTGVEDLQIWILGNNGSFLTSCFFGDTKIEYSGKTPETFVPEKTEPYILTPAIPRQPRLNGAKRFGVRPGNPIQIQIAASGVRPVIFKTTKLPLGLTLNPSTGLITGRVLKKGEYKFSVSISNNLGSDNDEYELVVGDKIALTPPMGWSSWNVWTSSIDQEKVMETLTSYKKYNLNQFGYTYINIDDGWQGKRGGKHNAILGNEKFPDMKAMVESIHKEGYKFGIYSSPWKTTYAGYIGSSADFKDGTTEINDLQFGVYPFHENDVKQWVEWGVDYMKYDWWPNDVPHTQSMSEALIDADRDIVFSISNAAPFDKAESWQKHTNLWRTTGDIFDSWPCIMGLGFSQERWAEFAGPGHWNDPDMMILGWTGVKEELHNTRLSADEQYTHVSMWALLSAPLILGCDLKKLDDFSLSLIRNFEVIDINQDKLGNQAISVKNDELKEVWIKPLFDGSLAVGLFNRGLNKTTIDISWEELNIEGNKTVRDLWRQKDLGDFNNVFNAEVPSHGVVLVRIYEK